MDYIEAMKRIELIVPMLRNDVETAVLSHEVMEAQNAIVPPGLKGHKTEYVVTYEAIQNALVLKLAMDVARVFDISANRGIERQDMASIPVLAMLMRVEGVREQLLANASTWISGIDWAGDDGAERSSELEDFALEVLQDEQLVDGNTCGTAIDEFLIVADRLSDENSPEALALSRVRGFRNRRLAHSLFNKEPDTYPSYSDLSLLLEMAKAAATLSAMAFEGLVVDFREKTERTRKNAEGYAECVLAALKRSSGGQQRLEHEA